MALDDVDKCSKAYRESAAFKRASFHPPDEIWSIFADADQFLDIVDYFKALTDALNIDQNLHGLEFYEVLKSKLTSWKCQSLWDLLNARMKHAEYKHENTRVAKNSKCIIIGAGPIGLRTAIESSLLGCQTVIVEKRKDFSRNNVLHLWPFLLTDFRGLGAKKFYGKFGSGSIEHINIKTLQAVLLKVALVLGVEIYSGVGFQELIEPTEEHGWRATFVPENHELSKYEFNIVIGADGKKNVLPGFTQIELRGSLAIGITCNFINRNTEVEKHCKEISGISYQFKPTFFKDLKAQHGVELENIVYYKDETHYFVMTALKSSLLNQGVLLQDYSDPSLLVQPKNICRERLVIYTCNAVKFATTLEVLEFKKLSNGNPDIALFDFTSLKKAENACRIIERKKHKLLLGLVGDSLIEPFWPTGSGCGRGVLSALDVAWTIRQFALNYPPLAIIRERENVFKLLSASTHDNIQKNFSSFTIDPKTRYSALDTKKVQNVSAIRSLYSTDDMENADLTLSSPPRVKKYGRLQTTVDRRKSGGTGTPSRVVRKNLAGKGKLHRQESKSTETRRIAARAAKAKEEEPISVGAKRNFWEEHNKKSSGESIHVPPKSKKPVRSGSVDLEGIVEDVDEMEDDVIIDNVESTQEKVDEETKSASLKRQGSKELLEASSKNKLKRQSTKGTLRRQSTKDVKKSKSKSLKRQSSKDDLESSSLSLHSSSGNKKTKSLKRQSSKDLLESSSHSLHSSSGNKKGKSLKRQSSKDNLGNSSPSGNRKVYQAKGGGLKARKASEKQDHTKQKRKSTMEKKLGSSFRKKENRKSADIEEAKVEAEPLRESAVDAKTFFTSWLQTLLPKLKKENASEPTTYEKPLETVAQASVVSVMAMSLLYDCNKVPKRRTTDLKLKELMAKNELNFLPKSTATNTQSELSDLKNSLSSGGNSIVKNSVLKYKMLMEKEEKKNDYYEFIKKPRLEREGAVEKDLDTVDHVNDGQPEKLPLLPVNDESTEFVPKDVIDIEKATIAEEQKEKKQLRIVKMNSYGGCNVDDEISLQLALEHFCNLQSPGNAVLMLQVLYNIHKRILDEPDKDKHYRIYTKSKIFQKYVWKWEGAESYFTYVGWMKVGDFLILSKSHPIHLTVKVIEDVFKKNKRTHLLYSGSEHSSSELRDGREIHSSSTKVNEDDMYTSYANIEVPTTSPDSAIGSGLEEDDIDSKLASGKKPVQRLQSVEHNLGDEEYVVVDFVKDPDVASEETLSEKEDVNNADQSHLRIESDHDDPEIPIGTFSPYVSVCIPEDTKNDSDFHLENTKIITPGISSAEPKVTKSNGPSISIQTISSDNDILPQASVHENESNLTCSVITERKISLDDDQIKAIVDELEITEDKIIDQNETNPTPNFIIESKIPLAVDQVEAKDDTVDIAVKIIDEEVEIVKVESIDFIKDSLEDNVIDDEIDRNINVVDHIIEDDSTERDYGDGRRVAYQTFTNCKETSNEKDEVRLKSSIPILVPNEAKLQETKSKDTKTKRKVFMTGRGLKGKKKSKKLSKDEQGNKNLPVNKVEKQVEIKPSVATNAIANSPKISSGLLRRSLPKDTSGGELKRASVDLGRSSSLKSLNKESRPSSIVMQNKLLFDQQIADGLKKKYPSSQDVRVPFAGTGQLKISAFEKTRPSSSSFNDKKTSRNSCEVDVDLKGIVSGARSLFEGGSLGSSSSIGGGKMRRSSLSSSSISSGLNTNSYKNLENNIEDLNQTPVTSSLELPKKLDNLPQQNIVNETILPAKIDNENTKLDRVHSQSSTSVASVKKKKKKFPFKKKKSKDVALICSAIIDEPFEERAIDVVSPATPSSVIAAQNENEIPTLSKEFQNNESETMPTSPVVIDDKASNEKEMLHKTESQDEIKCQNEKDLAVTNGVEINGNSTMIFMKENELSNISPHAPPMMTEICYSSVDSECKEKDDQGESKSELRVENRLSKKKKRLSKQRRKQSPLSDDESFTGSPLEIDKLACEEDVNPLVITDSKMSSLSFNKLETSGDECHLSDKIENDVEMKFHEGTHSSLNLSPISVNIDSLENEASIDGDFVEDQTNVEVESETNITNTGNDHADLDDTTDVALSSYEENGITLSGDISQNHENNDSKAKKKKGLPFRLKIGKKKDKPKSQLSNPSPSASMPNEEAINSSSKFQRKLLKMRDGSSAPNSPDSNKFRDRVHSESKLKSKNSETQLDVSPMRSVSSSSSVTGNLSDSQQSYSPSPSLKKKSSKFPFFKKKKSSDSVSSNRRESSSASERTDDADSTFTLNGATISEIDVSKLHNETNGHQVYKDVLI